MLESVSRYFPISYIWRLIILLLIWNIERYYHNLKNECKVSPSDVVTYDADGYEIRRSDVFLAGKMREKIAFLSIGIPIVYREYRAEKAIYFDRTLHALLKPLTVDEKDSILIVVLLVDVEIKKREFMLKLLMKKFGKEIETGLIDIIGVPERFYLQYHDLPPTLNDSPERMAWRAKQSLDYAFLFNYVFGTSEYYLQIEEDVIADDNFFQVMKKDIEMMNQISILKYASKIPSYNVNQGRLWGALSYFKVGFIGRLFPNEYTKTFASYLKSHYAVMPCDWTLDQFAKMYSIDLNVRNPLFEHIGKQSSSLGT